MKVETCEISNQGSSQKKKGKRVRESQAKPAHGSATKRIRQNVHLVLGETCPQDKERTWSALVAIDGIRVFVEYGLEGASDVGV